MVLLGCGEADRGKEMRIKALFDPIPVLDQCDAQRTGRWCKNWEDAHPDKRCSRLAKYEVGKRKLCLLHTKSAALDILLKEGKE